MVEKNRSPLLREHQCGRLILLTLRLVTLTQRRVLLCLQPTCFFLKKWNNAYDNCVGHWRFACCLLLFRPTSLSERGVHLKRATFNCITSCYTGSGVDPAPACLPAPRRGSPGSLILQSPWAFWLSTSAAMAKPRLAGKPNA